MSHINTICEVTINPGINLRTPNFAKYLNPQNFLLINGTWNIAQFNTPHDIINSLG